MINVENNFICDVSPRDAKTKLIIKSTRQNLTFSHCPLLTLIL